jgi:beta-glucosidase/6-phospho-beta-glucosidase/beta-galactosidase
MARFIFATGIENSYPTIALPDGTTKRVDEMEKCGHYARWREDFQLVREIGIHHLRYGPPLHRTHLGPGRYDWSFADETFACLRELKIEPIVDLCHFGVPDWLESFQNPDFPLHFAEYAGAFARRFPWCRLYTPVNEIFIAASFSAQYGWWNERLTSDRTFVTALKHLCQANVLAMRAILATQPAAWFIQSESSEYFHAEDPASETLADFLNQKRFLPLDFTYGQSVTVPVYEYLLDNGMTRAEYHWFEKNQVKGRCVLGTDYYYTNEHLVHGDGTTSSSGEIFGYYVLTKQYFDRYKLPVMHTETNIREGERGDEAVVWLKKEWAQMIRLRKDGVPIVGFTWYSLTDQVDWDSALRDDAGRVNALGLFDLDRQIRPVGKAYRTLIDLWDEILPMETMCLNFDGGI